MILTSLGALAALPFTSQVLTNISAAPATLRLGKGTVYTSPEAMAAIEPLTKSKVSIADLWVTESAEVSRAVTGLYAATPQVSIGTLNISSAAEVDAFLQAMADAILKSRPAKAA